MVRPAREEDAEALHTLSSAAIARSAAGHYDQRQRAAWAGRRTQEGHRWMIRETTTFVAVAGEEFAGFASVALHPVGELQAGEVDQLFVAPRLGGRGVARLLLDAVTAAAAEAGLRELPTHAAWRAVPTVEALGYCRCQTGKVQLGGVELTRAVVRRAIPTT